MGFGGRLFIKGAIDRCPACPRWGATSWSRERMRGLVLRKALVVPFLLDGLACSEETDSLPLLLFSEREDEDDSEAVESESDVHSFESDGSSFLFLFLLPFLLLSFKVASLVPLLTPSTPSR